MSTLWMEVRLSSTARFDDNGAYYINERMGAKYVKYYVQANNVFQLTHLYRQSKNNPNLVQTISTLKMLNLRSL